MTPARKNSTAPASKVAKGIDPREDKKAAVEALEAAKRDQERAAVTLGTAWPEYIEANRHRWGARHLADNLKAVEPGGKGARLRLEVHAISGLSPAQTPKFVRVTHRLSLNVAPGRFVRCYAVLRPPPGMGIVTRASAAA